MTRLSKIIAVSISYAAISACTAMNAGSSGQQVAASAAIRDAAGAQVGTAMLRRASSGWEIAVNVSGQSAGEHGIHLHEVGICGAPDFASAKGHLNPAGKVHGSANPAGMHMGDLPNLTIGSDGKGNAVIALPSGSDPASIFDADGTSIVIHAKPDDYRTDPSGNSGGRIACGVLSRV